MARRGRYTGRLAAATAPTLSLSPPRSTRPSIGRPARSAWRSPTATAELAGWARHASVACRARPLDGRGATRPGPAPPPVRGALQVGLDLLEAPAFGLGDEPLDEQPSHDAEHGIAQK